MSDVFQEVEEEYRRDQVAKMWAKYQVPLAVGVTVLVLAVAGYEGWSYWRAGQIEKSSRGFDRAAELVASGSGQEKEAADAFAKLAEGGSGGYALAARFQEAALRAEMGQIKEAVQLYDAVADGASDALFTDYAHLRAALLIADTASYDVVKRRVEPIAQGNGPWRTMATELLAYAAWRAGKKDDALKLYAEIQKAEDVAPGSKRRALEMTSLIAAGMKPSDVKETPGQAESLLPSTGGSLLPSITPEALPSPEATEEQPSSLLGAPEQPSTTP